MYLMFNASNVKLGIIYKMENVKNQIQLRIVLSIEVILISVNRVNKVIFWIKKIVFLIHLV